MQKFGLAIHLRNFKGNAEIHGNEFTNNHLNFNSICLQYENNSTQDGLTFDMAPATSWMAIDHFYSPNLDRTTQYLVPQQHHAHQLHSLIVFDNFATNRTLEISNNTFTRNLLVNSLISVSSPVGASNSSAQSQGQITIRYNNFTSSGSYIGTNLILITKQDQSLFSQPISITNYCGKGIDISYNNFTRIVGTCLTDTGIARVQCNNTQFAELVNTVYNDYGFINHTRQIAPSQGREGKAFDQASVEQLRSRIDNDTSVDSTIITGNRITNCSHGI